MLRTTSRVFERRRALIDPTQALVLREWQRVSEAGDWLASWQALLPQVVSAVSLAQVRSAALSQSAVVASLEEQGYRGAVAQLDPVAFAGWLEPDVSPWQVPLSSALGAAPVVTAREQGALQSGGRMLLSLTHLAVAAAGQLASQALIAATPGAMGAFADTPCCQRCAVLVGKKMPYGTEFKRHPRCNGEVVAVPEGRRSPVAPIEVDDITDLNRWQKAAIEDGADLTRVINAQTGVRGGSRVIGSRSPLVDNGMRTKVGAGRGGRNLRPTPKAIYRAAQGDRGAAQRMLREFGYIANPLP